MILVPTDNLEATALRKKPSFSIYMEIDGNMDTEQRFLTLPVEIRLGIYSHLFTSPKDSLFATFKVQSSGVVNKTQKRLKNRLGKTGLTAILRTCKGIYAEALPVLWQHTDLFLDVRTKLLYEPRISSSGLPIDLARHVNINFEYPKPSGYDPATGLAAYIETVSDVMQWFASGPELSSLNIVFQLSRPLNLKPFDLGAVSQKLRESRPKSRLTKAYLYPGSGPDLSVSGPVRDFFALLVDAVNA